MVVSSGVSSSFSFRFYGPQVVRVECYLPWESE